MYKARMPLLVRLFIVLMISSSLSGGRVTTVRAEICTWEGDTSDHWSNIGNWSCGHVPTAADDVVIPAETTFNPKAYVDETSVTANTLQINEGAQMTLANGSMKVNTLTNNGILNVDTSTYSALINNNISGFTINNNGTLNITGTNSVDIGSYDVDGTFNNSGTVNIQNSTGMRLFLLNTSGTHSGVFQGTNLSIAGDNNPTNTFSSTSLVDLNEWSIGDGIVDFGGTITSLNILYVLRVNTGSTLNLLDTANITQIAQKVNIDFSSKLILNDTSVNYIIPELLNFDGELQNKGNLLITSKLDWGFAKLTGCGTTTVSSGALFTFWGGNKIMDCQNLVNQATANWNYGDITLLNSAVFKNDGTFNANATTTMTGGETERFINNEYGFFYKKTEDTTTTVDVPFTNNGTVEVVAGELVFSGADIDLGDGTLDPGETLTIGEGISLVGSGTLNANLVNAGTVSPGSSAGIITVNGNYNQESTGILEIELGSPSSDKLVVNGEANLAGALNVTSLQGFTPQPGDSFTILSYASHIGSFPTVNLPDGYEWDLVYGDKELTLSLATGGSINGTITCSGNLETNASTVFVDLWKNSYEGEPDASLHIECDDSYTFNDLEDGTYFVASWLNLYGPESGPPDDGEPFEWYDPDGNGEPDGIIITGGSEATDIDIDLERYYLFLPLVIK